MSARKAGARGRALATLLTVATVLLPAAQAAKLSIGTVESIAPTQTGPGTTPPGQSARPGARELRFDAYGRRFVLQLATNPRLPGGEDLDVLEGELVGYTGSWVRLTRYDAGWHGVIFDGTEYFGVESAGHAGKSNAQAARLPPKATVIYRWKDVVVEDASFGGDSIPLAGTLAATASAVGAELPPPPALAATDVPVTRQLDVGLVVDPDEVTHDGGDTNSRSAAVARLNVADGILATQVGIRLHSVDRVTSFTAGNQPFTATTDAKTLLDQLGTWRGQDDVQGTNDLTHLFTGRDLDGQTVGIAYITSACDRRYAASLSEGRKTVDFDGLVAAHEIGHVLGAPHDAETGSECESTPTGYLMGTLLSQTTQGRTLSDCSLSHISTYTATASCLAAVTSADVGVGAPSSANIAVMQLSELSFTVRSNGSATATGTTFMLTLPVGVVAAGAGVPGGTCPVVDGPTVQCQLGDMAPGETRTVSVSVQAAAAGETQAHVEVNAQGDSVASNNSATVRLTAAAGANLHPAIVLDPTTVVQGAGTTARLSLINDGQANVADAQLTVTMDPGLSAQSATSTGGVSCTVASGAVTCSPFALASGATAEVQLVLQAGASAIGNQRLFAGLRSTTVVDPVPRDNDAVGTVAVTAPAPAPTPPGTGTPAPTPTGGGGGGGGGAFDLWLLLGLGALGLRPFAKWRRAAAALLMGGTAALAAPRLQAEQLPLWELGLGVGALGFSDYRGADSSHVYPLPVPHVVYRGRYLQADREGVRGLLLDRPRVTLGVSANATTPVNSDGIAARAGMPDLHPTVELGPSLDLHLWRSGDTRRLLDLRLPLRATVTAEADPRFIGWQFAPRLNLDVRDPFGLAGWNLGALVGPLFAQRRYHDYFYSVAPAFATAARPAYAASGGYAGAQVLLSASRRFQRGWFGAFARYDRLDGASFVDSPLVRRREAWMAGFGYAWILASSERLVDTGS